MYIYNYRQALCWPLRMFWFQPRTGDLGVIALKRSLRTERWAIVIVFEGAYFHALILNNKYCTLHVVRRPQEKSRWGWDRDIASVVPPAPAPPLDMLGPRSMPACLLVVLLRYRNGYSVCARLKIVRVCKDSCSSLCQRQRREWWFVCRVAGRLCIAHWLSLVILLIYKSHHQLFLREKRRLLWTWRPLR